MASGHDALFLDVEGASADEWLEVSRSEVRDAILPTYAGEKKPTRLSGGMVYEISWKKLKGHCDATGWSGSYRNSAGKLKDLDTHGVRGYGFAIALGEVIAIDCDIEDSETSELVLSCLCDAAEKATLPRRIRAGSGRWACLVTIDEAKTPFPNGIGRTAKGYEVELKGRDHLLVCAGVHPSGKNYRWIDGPCCAVVHLSIEQWSRFLQLCVDRVGMSWRDVGRKSDGGSLLRHEEGGFLATIDADFDVTTDSLAKWLLDAGQIHAKRGNVLDFAQCPWCAEHGIDTDYTATTSYFVGIDGKRSGFHCFHAHCAKRTLKDLELWAEQHGWQNPAKAKAQAKAKARTDIVEQATAPRPVVVEPVVVTEEQERRGYVEHPEGMTLETFHAAFDRKLKRKDPETGDTTVVTLPEFTVTSLTAFLGNPDLCGMDIRYDDFYGEVYTKAVGAEDWQVWNEHTTTNELTLRAEAIFGPMVGKSSEISRVFQAVARSPGHLGDAGLDAIAKLPEWDGVPRLDTWLIDYAGVKDAPGVRELCAYTLRAMLARLSCQKMSGVKADIIPIFFGEQKKRKSLLVKALSILGDDGFTDEVRFDADATDTLRITLGKCVVEIGELGGLKGDRKSRDDIKAWVTKTKDRMTQKYEKQARDYPRRWLPIITTNERQIMRDPTGDRRFAPVHIAEVGEVNLDGLAEVLPQLYAEAKARNASERGEVKDAQIALEDFLPQLQADFQDEDPWAKDVLEWADKHDFETFSATAIATDCIGMELRMVSRKDTNRIADILRKAGYRSTKHGWSK